MNRTRIDEFDEHDVRQIVARATALDAGREHRLNREDVHGILSQVGIDRATAERAIDQYAARKATANSPNRWSRMFIAGAAISGANAVLMSLVTNGPMLFGGPGLSILIFASGAAATLAGRDSGHRAFWMRNAGLWAGYVAMQVASGLFDGSILAEPGYGLALGFSAVTRWLLTSLIGSAIIGVRGRNSASRNQGGPAAEPARPSFKVRLGHRMKDWIDRWMERVRNPAPAGAR